MKEMPFTLARTQPPKKAALASGAEGHDEPARAGEGDGAPAELDGGHDRERDHGLAVLAVHADGGGVDGAGGERRRPPRRRASRARRARRRHGTDGLLASSELLAALRRWPRVGPPSTTAKSTCPTSRRGESGAAEPVDGAATNRSSRDGSSAGTDRDEHVARDRAVDGVHEVVVLGRHEHPEPGRLGQAAEPRPRRATAGSTPARRPPRAGAGRATPGGPPRGGAPGRARARPPRAASRAARRRAGRRRAGPSTVPRSGRAPARCRRARRRPPDATRRPCRRRR